MIGPYDCKAVSLPYIERKSTEVHPVELPADAPLATRAVWRKGGVAEGDQFATGWTTGVRFGGNSDPSTVWFFCYPAASCRLGGSAWNSRRSGYLKLFSPWSFWRPAHRLPR